MFKDKNDEDVVVHEFNLSELALNTEEIYEKVIGICMMEESGEEEDGLRYVNGYVQGNEVPYSIEGFDFLKIAERKEIELLLLLKPLLEGNRAGEELLDVYQVYKVFKDGVEKGLDLKKDYTIKIHAFGGEGENFSTEDFYFTYHPVYFTIFQPDKIAQIEEVVSSSEGRDFVRL